MKSYPVKYRRLLAALFSILFLCDARAASTVVLWDTIDRGATDRAKWQVVPSNLMMLEKDPLKASSDPGYYGREYQFTGDAVCQGNSGAW